METTESISYKKSRRLFTASFPLFRKGGFCPEEKKVNTGTLNLGIC